jgi:hypothetical protein
MNSDLQGKKAEKPVLTRAEQKAKLRAVKKHLSLNLYVPQEFIDPDYFYTFRADSIDGDIEKHMALGYEFVERPDGYTHHSYSRTTGETHVQATDKVITRNDGTGGKLYLMRIHKDTKALIDELNAEKNYLSSNAVADATQYNGIKPLTVE